MKAVSPSHHREAGVDQNQCEADADPQDADLGKVLKNVFEGGSCESVDFVVLGSVDGGENVGRVISLPES